MPSLQRISITIEPELLDQLDAFIARSGHSNRSEAIRDLIRDRVVRELPDESDAVGVVAITYDHEKRELSDQLVRTAHRHHDLVLATTHVHLDEQHCLEVSSLRGPRSQLEHFADHLIGMRGVVHGGFVLTRPPHR